MKTYYNFINESNEDDIDNKINNTNIKFDFMLFDHDIFFFQRTMLIFSIRRNPTDVLFYTVR